MNIGIYNPRVGVATAGGTETFLRELLKRLVDDHEVVLYTGAGDLVDEIAALDIDVRQFPFRQKESSSVAAVADRTPILPAEIESLSMYYNARRSDAFDTMGREVDVVSSHYYLDNLLLSRTVSDVPTLFRFPGIKQPSIRWRAMARLAAPDSYIANSESTKRRVDEWLDIEVDGVVHAGVDIDQFSPDVRPAFESEDPVILFVGRLDEGKGLEDLLEAVSILDTDPQLTIVGEGTLKTDLQQAASDLGIADQVAFPGAVPHDEIHRYYAAADVFCLPSYHEGFPVVNMEAMASSVPVVSTTIEAVRDQLSDGEHGLLVPPGDVEALSDALSRLLADPDLRAEFGGAGRRRAEGQFTWDVQADSMINHYAETATEI